MERVKASEAAENAPQVNIFPPSPNQGGDGKTEFTLWVFPLDQEWRGIFQAEYKKSAASPSRVEQRCLWPATRHLQLSKWLPIGF